MQDKLQEFKRLVLGEYTRAIHVEHGHAAKRTAIETLNWSRQIQQGFGYSHVYSHQAETYTALQQGKNVILTTPTASGKTGAFLPAVLEGLLKNPSATALFIYPLIALAQDQREKMQEFLERANLYWAAEEFQGSKTVQQAFRKGVRLISATPDKLHWSLAQPELTDFLQNLKFLVLDEAHTYRGGFGCEVSGLVRRILALAQGLGATPQVVLSTATIGNPEQFAEGLTGLRFTQVADSGAEKHSKSFYVVDHRGRARQFWDKVVQHTVACGLKTLVFFRGRSKANRMHSHYHNMYKDHVHVYMSGAGERDSRLTRFRQAASGVMFATSALEAGVDIGDLSVVVLDGYPGSRMTFRQMVGRAGRIASGLVLYLPAINEGGVPRPVDAFYSNPHNFRQLLTGAVERAVIESQNPYIAPKHALRLDYEAQSAGIATPELTPMFGGVATGSPLRRWNLRSDHDSKFYVVDKEKWQENPEHSIKNPLESPSRHYAYAEKHPEAQFVWDGIGYTVTDWLPSPHGTVILAEKNRSSDYTRGIFRTRVQPLSNRNWHIQGKLAYRLSEVSVHTEYLGFERLSSVFERKCPQCDTESVLEYCPQCNSKIKEKVQERKAGEILYPSPEALPSFKTFALEVGVNGNPETAHALKHALLKLIPEVVACDLNDLSGAFREDKDHYFFVYENWAGGLGISKRVLEDMDVLLKRALELCRNDCCEYGCYQCLELERCHAPRLNNGDKRGLDKAGAALVLEETLGMSAPEEVKPAVKPAPPKYDWMLRARELLELRGLSSSEVSKILGVPSREFVHLPSEPLKVRHATLGDGVLTGAVGMGRERVVRVKISGEEKKFLLSRTPLEVVV